MNACILTVIKNEHEYLDEWVSYHLDLGVSHIFILEDIDSDSHKEICSKYGEKVTLDSVLTVLSEDGKKEAKEVKELKKYSVQNLYFRSGLLYLQERYPNVYDWCFLIDCDEFITLENEKDNLGDVLSLYNDYEAIVLSWKCFGANGYVNKPNYAENGVVGTYTSEVGEKINNQIKTCYRLKSFKGEFLYTLHYPTNKCKWCNSDYVKTKDETSFHKIYLRHYITKSWEEYVWKRKVRGYVWGRERSYDFFFKLNPDMESKKDELIAKVMEEKLVVLPYKQSGSQGHEIKLMLKGWRKFCQFKYHFIVIGEFDDSLKDEFPWVEFIFVPSISKIEGQYTPHLDMQRKMKIVMAKYDRAYDGFIYVTDDEYAIKPFNLEDVTGIFYHAMNFTGCESDPTWYWSHDKWKTRRLLDRKGLPHINYTTHHPYYLEFKKLEEIWKKFNMLEESYVFDDVYFNYFPHEEPVLDSKIRLGIWSKNIFKKEFRKAVDNPEIKFVCNSVNGWSEELEDELEKIIS